SHLWPVGKPITYGVIDCGGDTSCSSGFTGSVPAALRRPLHLPVVAHGRCPTHRPRVVAPHTGPAEGPGPIYPVIAVPAAPAPPRPGGAGGGAALPPPPPAGSPPRGAGLGGARGFGEGGAEIRGPGAARGGPAGGKKAGHFQP